jgi:ArsR family transcriptional regulator, arsenate/arsenite/antimonite-responsive transcriptional repressor
MTALVENDHALVVELAGTLRVIADVNRLRILSLLMRQELCVCDLIEVLGLQQSLLSHHLGVLRRAGLIQDRREAQWIYYSIVPEKLADLNAQFSQLLDIAHLGPDAAYGASPHKCA